MAMAENEKGDTASSKEGEEAWGTLEELLLACAVSRHGTTSWDSIAMEVQKRTTTTTTTTSGNCENDFSDAFTPRNCEQRYDTLNRRFNVAGNAAMVDELRKLRVEELRREVERHDVSIVSLQLKVKRLEEERERSSSKAEEDGGDADAGTDLERRVDRRTSSGSADEPEHVAGEPEDRSFNESNSTRKRESDEDRNSEPDPVQAEPEKAPSRPGNNSGELRESVSESKRSGDVQSSASLSRRRRRGWRRSDGVGVGSSGDEVEAEEWSPANKGRDGKSQPLIRFLEIVRSHKHGLVFQRRLPSQETEKYRSLIRQHMDLETVQSKLDRGVYCDSHARFYRDILLVFTNAILFFCKSSTEHAAARELRKLVIKEIIAQRVARTPKPAPVVKPDLESQILDAVVKKPRSSTNIVVCRRRTNSSAMKPSSLSSEKNTSTNKEEEVKIESLNTKPSVDQKKGGDEKEEQKKAKVEKSNLAAKNLAKTMTSNNNASSGGKKSKGAAGVQQGESNNSNNASASNNSKKSNKDESSDEEDQPINKRRKQLVSSRKQGVVNFLKRIKQNSPSKEAGAKPNNTDEPQEEKASKAEIGKKKVAAVKKKDDDDDGAAKRRVSGRRPTKGEEAVKPETARRGGGRPPTRKASLGGGGTPDSGRLKRQRDGEKEAGGSGKTPPAKKRTRR